LRGKEGVGLRQVAFIKKRHNPNWNPE